MSSNSDKNTVPDDLPHQVQQVLASLGPASTDLDLDEDTKIWIDAMHEKHK